MHEGQLQILTRAGGKTEGKEAHAKTPGRIRRVGRRRIKARREANPPVLHRMFGWKMGVLKVHNGRPGTSRRGPGEVVAV